MRNDHPFSADQLVSLEPTSESLHLRYEEELANMFEQEITPLKRTSLVLVSLFGLITAILFAWLAITEQTIPLARWGIGIGALFALCWTAWAVSILWRGKLNTRWHGGVQATMVWTFSLLMVIFFMLIAFGMHNKALGVLMVLNGLVFLICAAVFLIRHVIEQAELRTREKLLAIELQVAELAESLGARRE